MFLCFASAGAGSQFDSLIGIRIGPQRQAWNHWPSPNCPSWLVPCILPAPAAHLPQAPGGGVAVWGSSGEATVVQSKVMTVEREESQQTQVIF